MFVEGVDPPGFASQQGHAPGDVNSKKFTPRSRQNSGVFNRDNDNAMMRSLHSGKRAPQRSRTTHEHIPGGPQMFTLTVAPSQSRPHTPAHVTPVPIVKGREAQSASLPTREQQQDEASDSVKALQSIQPRRPMLGKPRRSYSVMDYEPVLPWQRPAPGALTFSTLPAEMHFAFFDLLDPIDATCLGLTCKYLYSIHRRMHGSVPLSVRRDGPNELEWAWYRAAYPTPSMALTPCKPSTDVGHDSRPAGHLTALRVRGKGMCRKCGVSRCELHKHILEWMPAEYEYCSVRDRFVPSPQGEDVSRKSCYMSNPTNNSRCGRHRINRTREKSPTTIDA